MKRVYKGFVVVGLVAVLLAGCKTEEEKQILEEKKDFRLLYTYEEDRDREDTSAPRSEDEIVEDLVLEELGLGSKREGYRETGILKGQGIFIESAIVEGSTIPKVSAIKNNKLKNKDKMMQEQDLAKREEYLSLIANKEKLLASYNQDDGDYQEWLKEELDRQVRIQNGEDVGSASKDNFEEMWGKSSITNNKEFEMEKKRAREELEKEEERNKKREELNQYDIDKREKETLKKFKERQEKEAKRQEELDKELEEKLKERKEYLKGNDTDNNK